MNKVKQKLAIALLTNLMAYGCADHPGISGGLSSTESILVGYEGGINQDAASTRVSLDSLPTFDVSSYDFSLHSNEHSELDLANVKRLASAARMNEFSSSGPYSRSACELEELKRNIFEDAKSVDSLLCYVKAVVGKKSEAVVPLNSWAYYKMRLNVIEDAPAVDIKVRVGQFGQTFSLDVCSAKNNIYKHALELRLNRIDNGYEGYSVRAEYSEARSKRNKASRIDLSLKDKEGERFNFMSVIDRHYHSDNTTGETFSMHAVFDADNSNLANSLLSNSRKQSELGSYDMNVVSQWNYEGIGSTQLAVIADQVTSTEAQCLERGVPDGALGQCVDKCFNFDGTEISPSSNGRCMMNFASIESFSLSDHEGVRSFTAVENNASEFYSTVAAQKPIQNLADPEAETAFVNEWNCEPQQEFASLDTTDIELIQECGATVYLPDYESCEGTMWNEIILAGMPEA